MSTGDPGKTGRRLESWKEIAALFDRDEKTVRRWEKDLGLPVYRYPGSKGRVYAYAEELRDWASQPRERGEPAAASSLPGSSASDPLGIVPALDLAAPPAPAHGRFYHPWLWTLLGVSLALAAASWLLLPRPDATGPNQARSARHIPNPEAEQLYLQGRYAWNKRTPDSLREAVDDFTQAIVRDPAYAEAYVGLADSYNLLREFASMPDKEAYARSLAAATKAVELEPDSAEAQASLGFALFYGTHDEAGAEAAFRRAIALNPNYETALHWYGNVLTTLGRRDEALDMLNRAQKLEPASASIRADRAWSLYQFGQKEEGIRTLKQMTETDPNFVSPYRYLALIALHSRDCTSFIDLTRQAARLTQAPGINETVAAAEKGLKSGGCPGMMQAMVQLHRQRLAAGTITPADLAGIEAAAGDKTGALRDLRAAVEQGQLRPEQMRDCVFLTPILGEPEFQQLLKLAAEKRPTPR